LLRNRGQLDDAIASFRQAATINPTYMKALIKLGLALSEADQTEEAIDVFKQATDVRPDYVDLHYQIGLLFVQRNQFEMAVEHFEQAVSGNPGNVAFQANLALSLQNMGLIDRAQATWQIVSELAPDSEYAEQAQRAMAKSREE
jgi:tetratricopeptide (TPR) repeat protein